MKNLLYHEHETGKQKYFYIYNGGPNKEFSEYKRKPFSYLTKEKLLNIINKIVSSYFRFKKLKAQFNKD